MAQQFSASPALEFLSEIVSTGALGQHQVWNMPDYQRRFAWEWKECQALWDDIAQAAWTKEKQCYDGSVIFLKKDGNGVDVIDGQQRLSLSLLMAASRRVLRSRHVVKEQAETSVLVAKVNAIVYSNMARSFRLYEAAEVQEAYTLCTNGTPRNEANPANLFVRRLIQAYNYFRYLAKSCVSEDLLAVIEMAVTQNADNTIAPAVNAFQLFGIINPRGIPLNPLGVNKISLIQHRSEEDVTINRLKEIWRYLLEHLDKHNSKEESLTPELFSCKVVLLGSLTPIGDLRNFDQAHQRFERHSNNFILDVLDAGIRALPKHRNSNLHLFVY